MKNHTYVSIVDDCENIQDIEIVFNTKTKINDSFIENLAQHLSKMNGVKEVVFIKNDK